MEGKLCLNIESILQFAFHTVPHNPSERHHFGFQNIAVTFNKHVLSQQDFIKQLLDMK